MLHLAYTIDPAVKGTATPHAANPIPRSQPLPTLQVLLGENGAAVVLNNGIYRVVPGAGASGGTAVVTLRVASADALARLIQPFAGSRARVSADPGRNVLLISAEPNTREALVALAQIFDVNELAGSSYALLPVPAGTAKDFASAMQDLFRSQSGDALAGLVRMVPLEKLDAALVAASNARDLDEARRVFALVQRMHRFSQRSWHVYYLQNSHANDVAYLLQQVFTPNNVTAQPSSVMQPGGGARPYGSAIGQGGQTVGLAGLIQDSVARGNQGIPWLKDVPLLGLRAGTQDNQRTRTELLVMVTPHVVHDQRDARALTEALRAELPNAARVPQAVQSLPLSGSVDPSQRLRQQLRLGP
jgi:general secretion pathway protein D